jgi:Protein of unknown function (DUF4058)
MPIQAKRNLYPGINAHLNSLLQHEPGGWDSFVSHHISDIHHEIDQKLPEAYFARIECALQLKENTTIDDDMTWEDYLAGIVICQVKNNDLLGRPVTRIELLSPANKRGGAHHTHYLARRSETFDSQLRLVEIDYLHETPPVIGSLPSYADGDEGAFPYWVIISDPLPTVAKGHADVYDIGVDAALPIIAVPLAGSEAMALDLGAVYNHTFASSRFFQMVVDYAQEPIHFDRYTPADQSLIRARMTAIAEVQSMAT